MTDAVKEPVSVVSLPDNLKRYELPIYFAAIIIAGVLLSLIWDGATRWPSEWIIPAEGWVTDYIT